MGKSTVDEVRAAFSLPKEITDDRVDRGVGAAIDTLVSDDLQNASDHLAESIPSVCEREVPIDIEENGRQVACQRYDPETESKPLSWPRR